MTMINHYFELEKKYEKKYGAKTVVLYQCGGFFEIYGVENKDLSRELLRIRGSFFS